MSFIFGGDTGMSYEDVQRKRKIAESLLAANTRGSRNVGEGLGAIGRALAAKAIEKRTGAAMERLNKEAEDLYSGVFGGGISSGGGASAPRVGTKTEGAAIADDAMAAVIRQGLVDRGLPEHVADGFVMNMRDESGLDPSINERQPLVPGSRGGFGLAQWTGPRRVALEQFAASQGKPASDHNVQLDFLMQELQGSESQAGQAILSSKDAPSAATAIVNQFLRPAPEHRAARAARYGGQPAAGPQSGQPNVQAIVSALGNPIIRQDPGKVAVLNALLGQALKPEDPMQALELERAQLEIDALRNPPEPKPPSSVQEYQFYEQQERAAGRVPKSYAEWSIMDEQAANPAINSVPPDEEELRKKLGAKEGELWADYQRQGGVAAGTQADLDLLDELIQYAPQGPLTGRLAEALPGFNSAADAFQSIVKRVAPTMRAEGSGSTSDIEYGGMLRSLPQLMVRPEGNRAIVAMMRAKSQIDRERANVVNKYQNGEISAVEARKAIQEIDSRSIMTPELQAIIGATAPQGDQGEVGDIPTYNPETGQWE